MNLTTLRLILLCIAVSSLTPVTAQKKQYDFKPFKVDLSWGFVLPDGPGTRAGLLLVAEPKYAVIPNLAVGLRTEAAFGTRDYTVNDGVRQFDSETKRAASLLATADYYINRRPAFRPYIGGGAGIFFTRTQIDNDDHVDFVDTRSSIFGGMVRAGFEVLHFRFGMEYNLIAPTTVADYYNPGSTLDSKNGYLSFKLGFLIGGGRIKKTHRWPSSKQSPE